MQTDRILPYTIIALLLTMLFAAGCQHSKPVWATVSIRDAASGEPVQGAQIQTLQSNDTGWDYPTIVREQTDDNGRCTFLVASGKVLYRLNMIAEGYPETCIDISPSCHEYAVNRGWQSGSMRTESGEANDKTLEVKVEFEDRSEYLW